MVLTPLLARLVAVVAQVAGVSRGFIGAVPTVEPPLRRVTPLADDEVGVTPPASALPASRMIVHRRAPSWCDRREELERDHARVRNTGRTSASQEGSGCYPGLPPLRRPLRRRGLPRTRRDGRLLGVRRSVLRHPRTPSGYKRRAHSPSRGWVPGPWSLVLGLTCSSAAIPTPSDSYAHSRRGLHPRESRGATSLRSEGTDDDLRARARLSSITTQSHTLGVNGTSFSFNSFQPIVAGSPTCVVVRKLLGWLRKPPPVELASRCTTSADVPARAPGEEDRRCPRRFRSRSGFQPRPVGVRRAAP